MSEITGSIIIAVIVLGGIILAVGAMLADDYDDWQNDDWR